MSIGHTAIGSFPVLPSPDVLWKPSRSTKRPLGPNSPALLENLAQSVAKRMLFLFKISLSERPAVSPGRHFPFPVNGKLTNVCTDYSRMDAKACTPQAKGAPVFPYHLTKGRGEDLAKVCAMLCSGKKPASVGTGFRKQVQDVKEAVMCHSYTQGAKGCAGQTVWRSWDSLYQTLKLRATKSLHVLFTSKQIRSTGHWA